MPINPPNEIPPTEAECTAIASALNTAGLKDHYANWWTWEGILQIWNDAQDQELKALIRKLGILIYGGG